MERPPQLETRRAALAERGLLMVCGKGGVGKTTVAAALAGRAAQLGRRPLVVELDARSSLCGVWGGPRLGGRPQHQGGGVYAMALDFDAGLLDYLTTIVRSRVLARAVASNGFFRGLFAAVPAVAELVTLHVLVSLSKSPAAWSPIVVDMPSSGHAQMLLDAGSTLGEVARVGPIASTLMASRRLLEDSTTSAIVVVTTPEELPVRETIQFCGGRESHPALRACTLVVNRVPPMPELLPSASRDLRRAAVSCAQAQAIADCSLAQALQRRHQSSRRQIESLTAALRPPLLEIEDFGAEGPSHAQLCEIGGRLLVGGARPVSVSPQPEVHDARI